MADPGPTDSLNVIVNQSLFSDRIRRWCQAVGQESLSALNREMVILVGHVFREADAVVAYTESKVWIVSREPDRDLSLSEMAGPSR